MNFLLIFLAFFSGFGFSIIFWIILTIAIIIIVAIWTPKKISKTEPVQKEHGEHKKRKLSPWDYVIIIGTILVIITTSYYLGKTSDKKPAPPPTKQMDSIEINGSSLSSGTTFTTGYSIIFHCNQPYQVVNKSNNKYDGEANKDVDIGWCEANTELKFRTRNGTKTKMYIEKKY